MGDELGDDVDETFEQRYERLHADNVRRVTELAARQVPLDTTSFYVEALISYLFPEGSAERVSFLLPVEEHICFLLDQLGAQMREAILTAGYSADELTETARRMGLNLKGLDGGG